MHQLGFNRRKKHLHGRGEDLTISNFRLPERETPPRTWRRPNGLLNVVPRSGNTSTDVEKTSSSIFLPSLSWKHLHGRGEDFFLIICEYPKVETPPRTWRRPKPAQQSLAPRRNTSTDVEKTSQTSHLPNQEKKHLHGRGEDQVYTSKKSDVAETPPRTWRRPIT